MRRRRDRGGEEEEVGRIVREDERLMGKREREGVGKGAEKGAGRKWG